MQPSSSVYLLAAWCGKKVGARGASNTRAPWHQPSVEVDAMASLPFPVRACESNPPPTYTGRLTVGVGTFLADLLNERAVLTLHGPSGEGVFWVGAVVENGRVTGMQFHRFGTGEL